jgi:hypothetical protein
MTPAGRKASYMIAVTLVTLLASCADPSLPSVESCRLTRTDTEILRVALASVIEPSLGAPSRRVMVLTTPTLRIALWQAPPPSFPPSPPAPFAGSRADAVPPSPRGPLDAALFSSEERVAWTRRNRVAREIPDLAIAGLVNRHGTHVDSADWMVVAATAPIYPTKDAAVLYAQFTCGNTCGEGLLIRLSRDGPSWRITASQRLWIS